jgi:hypothetical protein
MGNPLQGAMAQMLMQKLAQQGQGGAPSPGSMALGGPGAGGPSGSPADAAAQMSLQRDLSSLRQADPMALAKRIKDMHDEITTMISQSGSSVPGVARALAKTLQGFGSALKEAQTAAATQQMATPIQASAAQGAPGMGGGPAPGPSMGGM